MGEQIKSRKRVKDYAEVFTNEREVKAMCDLIPSDVWENIESTFLEPAVGEGVFLIEILKRKFKLCKTAKDGLKALASVYGIDIQADNCDITRKNLLKLYMEHFPNATELSILMASGILANNIICGDSLKIMKEWENSNESNND